MSVRKVHLMMLAVVACIAVAAPVASAGGWFSKMGDVKEVSLNEILRNPRDYVDVNVQFKAYFNAVGHSYNPYYTRFTEVMYGNFSVWPIDARLYEKRDFQRTYGFLFMKRVNKEWESVQRLERLEVVEVTGTVREIFKGQPWIEVLEVDSGSGGLDKEDVRDVIAGDAYFLAGKYREAADRYDDAVHSSLPDVVRADILRRLGDAEYHAADYEDARSAYRDALRLVPESAVLKRNLEAAEQGIRREYARRRDKAFDEAPAEPAPRTAELVEGYTNGVDEVIRLLEDPDAVEAENEEWQLELEKRSARVRGLEVVATAVDAEPSGAKTAGPEAAGPVVDEGADEETVVDEAEDGCGSVVDDGGVEDVDESEGCAEVVQPVEDDSVEQPVVEDDSVEQPVVEDESVEQPVDEESVEQPVEDDSVVEDESVEQPVDEESVEQPVDEVDEVEQPVDEVDEVEQPAEGCGEVDAPVAGEEPVDGVEAEGCGESVAVPVDGADEVVLEEGCGEVVAIEADVTDDPRVVQVGDVRVHVPRLPFFGCDDVTLDDFRAVIEEVLRNPEQ